MTIFRISALLIGLLTLTACETVDGAGEDISNAGGAISDASKEVQDDI